MANATDAITVTTRLQVANLKHKETQDPGSLKFDQAAQGAHSPIVTVGTSEEDLAVGDVSTLGWLYLQNLEPDGGNYVTWGPKDTTMKALGRLEAGETAVLRLEPGITLRWIANTNPVKVKVFLLQD